MQHKKENVIPPIGLGTWKLYGQECTDVVRTALELGYRHIDTADVYHNHLNIAEAIHGWPREEIFLATKIYTEDLTPDRVRNCISRFLKELHVDYLDLLLIHWPNPHVDLVKTIETMGEAKEKGFIRYIGLSNFVRSHLKDLTAHHFPILTNQFEMHPYLQRKELVKTCKELGIEVTAYRPFAKGAFEHDPVLQSIGEKHQKTPSQIVLRWLIQQNISTIPKASSLKHLKENLDIFNFSLDTDDLAKIATLDRGQRYCTPEGVTIYED